MVKVYDVEEIEKEFSPEGVNVLSAMKAQFELLRQMNCPNCGFVKVLSKMEVIAEFAKRRQKKGESLEDTVKIMKLKVEEAKKEMKKVGNE